MIRVSRSQAATLSTGQLHGLLKDAFTAMATVPRDSQQQRDALATVRAIKSVLALRKPGL